MNSLMIRHDSSVCHIRLNRPEVRNAFDEDAISELTAAFLAVGDSRAVVLSGEGKVFCAGGDLEWMRRSVFLSDDQNKADAGALEAMFRAVDECPCPVIGQVHGAAFGGGLGLVCACDIVVAASNTKFCFSEVKLGLAPAVISPFAIKKMGVSAARRYFLTAEVFDAAEAWRVGLVHEVVDESELTQAVDSLLDSVRMAGPNAAREAKSLIRAVGFGGDSDGRCAEVISRLRVSEEGQEGVRAFLEKRKPNWA